MLLCNTDFFGLMYPIRHHTIQLVPCLERALEASVLPTFSVLFFFPQTQTKKEQKISVLGTPIVYEAKSAQTRIMRKTAESKMGWNT